MAQKIKIGIIGDFESKSRSHSATNKALNHAANLLGIDVAITWLPTVSLESESAAGVLKKFDALWCAPGSPYKSPNGALQAIRFARECGWPFIGT
jgi:CTP synthase (UTP-ammonia lyase)